MTSVKRKRSRKSGIQYRRDEICTDDEAALDTSLIASRHYTVHPGRKRNALSTTFHFERRAEENEGQNSGEVCTPAAVEASLWDFEDAEMFIDEDDDTDLTYQRSRKRSSVSVFN